MKYLLFLFSLFFVNFSMNAQTHIIDVKEKPSKTVIYDSLYNIGYLKETENSIKKYIGQELLFLNRSKSNVPQYYANFDYEKPIVVDTVWLKIRKNKRKINPDDYRLVWTTSYNPIYVNGEIVVLAGAGAYHYDKKTDRGLFSYVEENEYINMEGNEYLKNPRRNGYFTHYSSIEGKTFKILDIKLEKVGSVSKSFVFKLQSTNNQILYWTAECNTMVYKKIAYPVIVKGYLDKLKDLYLNKDFYFKSSEYKGQKYVCDLIFRPDDSGYLVPYMKLNDKDNDTRYLRLINAPKLFDSEIFENQGLMLDGDLLVEAEVFESEKERYEQEQQAIADQIIKEKKIRETNILKKYGNYYGKLILEHVVKIGMNKDMVIESWGVPRDVNRTIGSYGVHEQWCYDGSYLYFKNGKLTTIQD